MANFGDYVTYDGLIYRIVAISDDAEPEYTLEPVRLEEVSLSRTVTSSQKQRFLIPSGGENLSAIAESSVTPVGEGTAKAKALPDGKVRVKFDSNGGSDVDSQIIDDGGVVAEPVDPTLEGFTFDAWYYDDETFAEAVTFATDVFTDDTTIFANWTENE